MNNQPCVYKIKFCKILMKKACTKPMYEMCTHLLSLLRHNKLIHFSNSTSTKKILRKVLCPKKNGEGGRWEGGTQFLSIRAPPLSLQKSSPKFILHMISKSAHFCHGLYLIYIKLVFFLGIISPPPTTLKP